MSWHHICFVMWSKEFLKYLEDENKYIWFECSCGTVALYDPFFWRIIGLRILPIWKLAELPQDLSRNFRWAVWWSVATACYIVWLFRFIKPFSITLLYYLCKIIHILLFIATNIWLQHNFAYPRTPYLHRDSRSETYNTHIGCRRCLVLLLFFNPRCKIVNWTCIFWL